MHPFRLVTHGQFWSRDKDGGHTIRSAISENPMLHVNLMVLCFIEPELMWPIKVLHCRNENFQTFCSSDLNLDPMTFMYELDLSSLEICWMCKYDLPTSRLSKVGYRLANRQTEKQTDRHDRNYIPRRFAAGQLTTGENSKRLSYQ